MGNIYVYPKLSDKDLLLFRLGGAGLGNILFTYARAVVYAEKHENVKIIWPTWFSLKIGPFLRREKDKRLYNDLFSNNLHYISGIKKTILLLTKKKVQEKEAIKLRNIDDKIIIFKGFDDCFSNINDDSEIVFNNIIKILNKKQRKALEFDASDAIVVHVRLGDFSRENSKAIEGAHDTSIPIEWYVKMISEIRRIKGNMKVYIFSDGTDEELAPILKLEDVQRVFLGSAIADIIGLSRGKYLIASGSSFSMWARYLGRNTCIMYPNQQKQKILGDKDRCKEIITLDRIEDL